MRLRPIWAEDNAESLRRDLEGALMIACLGQGTTQPTQVNYSLTIPVY